MSRYVEIKKDLRRSKMLEDFTTYSYRQKAGDVESSSKIKL